MNSESVGVSAEDKYALLDMTAGPQIFPHPFTFGNLGHAMSHLGPKWDFLWDFRFVRGPIYNDIKDAFEEAVGWQENSLALASRDNIHRVQESTKLPETNIVRMRRKRLPKHRLDLSIFGEDPEDLDFALNLDGILDFARTHSDPELDDELVELGMVEDDRDVDWHTDQLLSELDCDVSFLDQAEMGCFHDHVLKSRAHLLDTFLGGIAGNSLLTELAIAFEDDRVKVIPYHAFGMHNLITPNDNLVLVRPGRESASYWARFKSDLQRLEMLLNAGAKEGEIELLLRQNPLFLRGLNYRKVYPQILLPLEPDNKLKPDIIAEPCSSEWCHIIDYKGSTQKLIVGRDNRLTLASGIHSVVSQLREYAACFDHQKIRDYAKQKYGILCHKPRLVAIVGRDPQGMNPDQVHRAMTAYDGFDIVTYDALVRAARQLLLL